VATVRIIGAMSPRTLPTMILLTLLWPSACGDDGQAAGDVLDKDTAGADTSAVDAVDAGDTGADTSDAADTGGGSFTPDFESSPAVVRVRINDFGAEGFYTYVLGNLAAAPQPEVYTVDTEDGSCRLLRRGEAVCDPACDWPQVCGVDGACADYPEPLGAGTLTVTDGEATRTVDFDGYSYWLQSQGLPFEPGETVTVSAPGDAFAAFSASGVMPDTLVSPDLQATDLTADGDLLFTWEPPSAGGTDAHVRITLNAGYGHGLPLEAVIECDVPDTGSFAVPDALRAELPPPNTWGCGECPESFLTRYRKTTVQAGDVAVDVIFESPLRFYPAWPE